MTTPPLLMLAEGRRPRARKMPIVRPKEIELHMAVAGTLRRFARPDWQWTHIPNGEVRDKRTAAKLRAMGTRPGWPDFVFVPPAGQMHCLELKRIGEGLSDSQEEFRVWCVQHNVPHAVVRTIDEALDVFDRWNCLTLHLSRAARIGGAL